MEAAAPKYEGYSAQQDYSKRNALNVHFQKTLIDEPTSLHLSIKPTSL
ncbi:hypothetical protein [Pedobacter suwonensis]